MIKELVNEIKIENFNGIDEYEQYRHMIKTIVAIYGDEKKIHINKWYDKDKEMNYIDKIYYLNKFGLIFFYRTGAYEDHSPITINDFKDVDYEVRGYSNPRVPVFKSGDFNILKPGRWQNRFLKLYDLSCGKILKIQSQNSNDHGQLSLKKK